MKKKIVAFAMVFALAAVAVVGGSLAYFTDTETADNNFTVGNVSIELIEQEKQYKEGTDQYELVEFTNDKVLMPGMQNAVDKIVTVKNTGDNAAYVRVKITVPAALKDVIHLNQETDTQWSELTSSPDDEENLVYTAIYNKALAGKSVVDDETVYDISEVVLSSIYLDSTVNCDENGEYYFVKTVKGDTGAMEVRENIDLDPQSVVVNVVAEAIQADGFESAKDAFDAYDAQK